MRFASSSSVISFSGLTRALLPPLKSKPVLILLLGISAATIAGSPFAKKVYSALLVFVLMLILFISVIFKDDIASE